MHTMHLYEILKKDGEINLKGLPFKKGEKVEFIVISQSDKEIPNKMTGAELAKSEIIGIWKNRKITDSEAFVKKLRNNMQKRDFDYDAA